MQAQLSEMAPIFAALADKNGINPADLPANR
jgi:hypothetical protein